jgi:hypothetical protein
MQADVLVKPQMGLAYSTFTTAPEYLWLFCWRTESCSCCLTRKPEKWSVKMSGHSDLEK